MCERSTVKLLLLFFKLTYPCLTSESQSIATQKQTIVYDINIKAEIVSPEAAKIIFRSIDKLLEVQCVLYF